MSEDSEQERERLARVYAGMTAEELQKVANDAFELTDIAHQLLKNEISRRGLGIALNDQPGFDQVEKRDLLMLRRFRDLPEALLVSKGQARVRGNRILSRRRQHGAAGLVLFEPAWRREAVS